jgi:uncharacterized membrane protein
MEILRTASLVTAAITTGLIAGLFYSFACSVMLGLGRADDRTFVEAMQRINEAILNGWFMLSFVGAWLLTAATGVLHGREDGRPVLPWIIAAFLLYTVMLAITSFINVPLNDTLAAAGAPDRIGDLAKVRSDFETTWVAWNVVRVVTSTGAFGCLCWALVLHGRIKSAA